MTFSYKRMSKSVVLISSLERFPGAETIIILRSGSSLTIFNTFLICLALETELPPNLATFIIKQPF